MLAFLVLRSTYYANIMPGAKEYLLCYHYAWCYGVPLMLALCLVLSSAYYASISSLAPVSYMFVFFTSIEKWFFFL